MDERRSYWAWTASSAMHGALLAFIVLGFAAAPKFEDSPEAIPVETVSQSELNQIMNGEKDAKPAPEPPPTPRLPLAARSRRPTCAPSEAADARAAAQARAAAEARAAAVAAAKTGAAAAAEAHAEDAPEPPRARRSPNPPEKPKQDRIAKAVERRTKPKPHARLRSERDRQTDRPERSRGARTRQARRGRRLRACRIMTRRACRCRWPRRSTPG